MYALMCIALIVNIACAFIMLPIDKGTAILNMCAALFCFIHIVLEPAENEDASND
jgi:hypothetical protein